jgi:hypothetical protein
MASFDIGSTDGLSIFANNDDMFNISTDIGPDFILDQGHDRGIADIGMIQNVTSDVIADIPNEAPIDFINYNNNQARSVSDLDIGKSQRIIRKKTDSVASNKTIEAEPEPIKKKKSQNSFPQNSFPQNSFPQNSFQQPNQKVLTHPPSMSPLAMKEPDTPPNIGMNLGFDDLLDGRKLKPVDIPDDISIEEKSQSTIKHGDIDDYPSAPNSPDYRSFKPISSSPLPESPLPTTIR